VTSRHKPDSCAGCACESHGTDFSRVEGTGSNHVMLVGEASGEMEARDGLPFRPYAPAGSLLERTFRRMGMDRQQFSTTNILRCRPRNNWLEGAPWEYSAINHCKSNLDDAIADRRPRCIVALGGTALRELTGMTGASRGITHLAGYVLPATVGRKWPAVAEQRLVELGVTSLSSDAIPVIANYHPAFLRRGKASHQGLFARILHRAVQISAGRDTAFEWNIDPEVDHVRLNYQTRPTTDEAMAFANYVLDNSRLPVSYDLETEESASLDEDAREGFVDTHIRLMQFAIGGKGAIALPREPGFEKARQAILHSPNTKCGHNVWLFDNKVLRAAGEREGIDLAPRGIIHDTLQMFHHWQPDLPAHLQFCAQFVSFPFPWKHLAGSHIAFYGCADVDATLRLYTFLEAALKRDGIHGDSTLGYLGQVAAVRPVLAAMEDRGMPIDDSARLALDEEFTLAQSTLGRELAALAPDSCKRVHPKQGYKGVPPQVKECVLIFASDPNGIPPERQRYQDGEDGEWYRYEQREFPVPDDNLTLIPTLRWCRVYDFNPNSKDQVIAYMKSKGHKIPKSKEEHEDGTQKDTTAEKELRRLAVRTGDNFYLKVIEYRGFTKLRSTYIDGFTPGSDGCVHTTFTFAPAIGQLSCCAGWTTVKTSKGNIPISDIRRGDLVWTHRGRWREVLAKWTHPNNEMVEIKFSNGQVLTCTTDHKLLVLDHEHKQGMADRREHSEGSRVVSQQGSSNPTRNCGPDGHSDRERLVGTETPHAAGGVQSSKQTALLQIENGQEESHAREDRRTASEMDWCGGRWVRVSDLLGEWNASVRASSHDGGSIGIENSPEKIRCTSHQRRHEGQSAGQLCIGHEGRSRGYTLASADRLEGVTIEKVVAMGSVPVHDITVEEDESYESCGVFSHNSRNPNIQNFTKLKPTVALAKAMRKMVAAKPGHILTEWDFKSCHIITLGFLAEDLNYMRLGRLDMHSFVAGHFLKLWNGFKIFNESDDQLRARFKWLKSDPARKRVRDDQAKHGILGIGNGLRAKGLYERYMESFPPTACTSCGGTGKETGVRGLRNCRVCIGTGLQSGQRTAEAVLEVAEALFPKVFTYQERQRKEAHETQRLATPFGYARRFYEVYRWDGKRNAWGHGDQAEEAVAYRLANIAFGHIREKLKELHHAGADDKYGLFNNVHDSFMFHFPEHLLAEHIAEVYPILTTPSHVLKHPTICPGGLVMDVEGAWGKYWSSMQEIIIKDTPPPPSPDSECVGSAIPHPQ
jgi:uracil-DNA glycosylase family 4